MKLKYFAIKDLAVGAFMTPWPAQSTPAALRSFKDEINGRGQQGSPLAAHPEDYELYELAEWSGLTGYFRHCEGEDCKVFDEDSFKPILVVRGKDVLNTAQ